MKYIHIAMAIVTLLCLGVIVYMATMICLMLMYPQHQQPEPQPTRTINYERPEKTPPIAKKVVRNVKPDYTDAAKWYWDIESNSFKRRTLK